MFLGCTGNTLQGLWLPLNPVLLQKVWRTSLKEHIRTPSEACGRKYFLKACSLKLLYSLEEGTWRRWIGRWGREHCCHPYRMSNCCRLLGSSLIFYVVAKFSWIGLWVKGHVRDFSKVLHLQIYLLQRSGIDRRAAKHIQRPRRPGRRSQMSIITQCLGWGGAPW